MFAVGDVVAVGGVGGGGVVVCFVGVVKANGLVIVVVARVIVAVFVAAFVAVFVVVGVWSLLPESRRNFWCSVGAVTVVGGGGGGGVNIGFVGAVNAIELVMIVVSLVSAGGFAVVGG